MILKNRFSSLNFKHHLSSSITKSLAQITSNATERRCPNHRTNKSQSTHFFISNALKTSAKLGHFNGGKQLHSHVIKLGYYSLLSMQNQILNVYVKCKELFDAHKMFDEILHRNVVTWNILISGVIDYGGCNGISNWFLGFHYFRKMLLEVVVPDYLTFNGLIRVCVETNDVKIGEELHCFVMKLGWFSDGFVGGGLIDFYGKFGLIGQAKQVFEDVLIKDLVLWNVLINSFSQHCLEKEAFGVYKWMRMEGVKGDEFTFTSLLSSCGILKSCDTVRQIHGLIISLSFDSDLLLASALVDMYAKSGSIDDARNVFYTMAIRNVVSWTTLIVGYGRNGDGSEAMILLRDMFREGYAPDELTLSSICSSCGHLSSTVKTMQIHAYIVQKGFQSFLSIANALVNAYSKSGWLVYAIQCFSSIPDPDLVSWTSILNAYAFHGFSRESIRVFEKVLSSELRPDQIVFLSVLSACSHGGLVSEGLYYFDLMVNYFGIMPNSEHYTCLIDILGRSGFLNEAFNVLISMPFEPGSDILGAFSGSCKVHGNVGFAKWASGKLFNLEPYKPVNYALISNCYAFVGDWPDAARVRKMMKEACDNKVPGCSWIEIGGEVHTFTSSDKSHFEAIDVYLMLEVLVMVMKDDESYI